MDPAPNLNDVLFMHAALVKQYGGASGIRDVGSLEAAISRPWGVSFGREHFPTPSDEAAALTESIIKRHPFVDGNKRTGVTAGVYLLESLGHRLSVGEGGIEELAVSIANGEVSLEEVSEWFERNSRRR